MTMDAFRHSFLINYSGLTLIYSTYITLSCLACRTPGAPLTFGTGWCPLKLSLARLDMESSSQVGKHNVKSNGPLNGANVGPL